MAGTYHTPGVYIEEQNAFSDSVIAVETAVPVFIGYTEKAEQNGQSLYKQAVRIHSLTEFEKLFGKGPGAALQFSLQAAVAGGVAFPLKPIIALAQKQFVMSLQSAVYRLYHSLKLFFLNGGGDCYIISAGNYRMPPALTDIVAGLDLLVKEPVPAMLVIPDAVSLSAEDHATLVQLSLAHCSQMQNRVAILDLHDGALSNYSQVEQAINDFRKGTGDIGLSYGAAYFPWLVTGIVVRAEISFLNLPENLADYLEQTTEVLKALEPLAALRLAHAKNADDAANHKLISEGNAALLAASKYYQELISAALGIANVLPPSGAMAGIYALTDTSRTVSKAPVNVTLAAVLAPTFNFTDQQQIALNLDTSGKAVNPIRAFQMKGVMAWGAKTLDDNSQDFRYINVRRTLIMIEQSVKQAAKAFVFEPNTADTWAKLKAMIENFLFAFWKTGGLAGAKPDEAYRVQIGLGSTMTAQDILDGVMRVTVEVAVSFPAEFIVVSFEQEVQKS